MIYLKLFWSFFRIELFTFGGGYAAIPLIQNIIVDMNQWLTLSEFTNLITISEMTPGPIAINSATFVGMHIAGLPGAIVSTIGCVLPSILVVSLLTFIYFKHENLSFIKGVLGGLRPAVVALIASAGLSIFVMSVWGNKGVTFNLSNINFVAVILFLLGFYAMKKFKPNPIYVMAGSGIAGMIIYQLI